MKLQDRDTSFEWFCGKTTGIRAAIQNNLHSADASGHRNHSRRRIAWGRRFVTIRSRIVDYQPPYCYYFHDAIHPFVGIDIPPKRDQHPQAPITCATDDRLFYRGDVVELDVTHSEGGWGKIIRLVDSSGRTHDAHWDFNPDDDLLAHFPDPPPLPSNPIILDCIEQWINNDGARIRIEFTPAHWNIMTKSAPALSQPTIRFVSMEVLHTDAWSQTPAGYMHFDREVPFSAISPIFVRDDFTRQMDEYFIARWWAGWRPNFNGIITPGIGATIQQRHFTKAPHLILGRNILYA